MKVGLALSGGGTRAIAFHLGVLLRLAHCNVFDRITRLSTVSGGSLVAALIYTHGNAKPVWPDARTFIQSTYPVLRQLLISTDLLSLKTIIRCPHLTFPFLTRRSLSVSKLLRSRWRVIGSLSELPENPYWIINTTCIETGKNWRFSRKEMGDWVFGRNYQPSYDIADVVAASAAIPYALGAMSFKLPNNGWFECDPSTGIPVKEKELPLDTVRLWDGGAYENLGLEPLYKPGRGSIECDNVIVSDASGYVPSLDVKRGFRNFFGGELLMPRLFDISSDQIRSLRSRMFIEAIVNNQVKGGLIRMGKSAREIFHQSETYIDEQNLLNRLNKNNTEKAWKTPTHLKALSANQFDLISRHGFETADATLIAYCKHITFKSTSWSS